MPPETTLTQGVDIVIPVHNSLHHVRPCLTSVLARTSGLYHLYVVDDGSDRYTHAAMAEMLSGHEDHATLLWSATGSGYLRAVNRGMRAGTNPYLVALNSDVVVATGWLERLLWPFDTDPAIAVINPVSNWANWTRVPFAPGFTVREYADFLAQAGGARCPDIYNASGFCFAIRRRVADEIGLFDEVYGNGYWEETDFCMRALDRGHRVVVNLGSFVYHFGWGSFKEGGRNEQMERNREIFMERWGEPFLECQRRWKEEHALAPLEAAITRRREQVEKPKLSRLARLYRLMSYGPRITAQVLASRVSNKVLHTRFETSGARRSIARWERHFAVPETGHPRQDERRKREVQQQLGRLALAPSSTHRRRTGPLRVLYILPAIKLYGGIISVLQIVNELALREESANIVSYGEYDPDLMRAFPMYANPYHFKHRAAMLHNFPECDLVVATRWDTVYDAVLLKQHRPELRLAYFVQDYEPDFYPVDSEQSRLAEISYHLIADKIVKTKWLARKLRPFPGRVHQIPLGLHLDIFYDRQDPRREEALSVSGMARPTSKYRNYEGLLRIFEELHRRRPELQLHLYGAEINASKLPFPCECHGRLYRMEDVARLHSRSTILLDSSTFQGFGRPGLEAMACGAAAVLTRNGGITEYAKHEYNCLLIDPYDQQDIVTTVLRMADDEALRQQLVARGHETARQFDHRVEGERTLALFRSLLEAE